MTEQDNNWEEFINDDTFISWVFKSNEKHVRKWDFWIQENPSKKELVNEIASVLNLSKLKEEPINDEQKEKAEKRLRVAIATSSNPGKVVNIKRKRIWYYAAAVLIISLAFGLAYQFHTKSPEQIASNYGEVLKNKLPDGTEVILNAHSKLTLGKIWQSGNTREVWIKGEAFFHVKKTPEHDKFIVHTDAFDIEVTGTSFNVKNLDGKSSIILKEGSVNIHCKGETDIKMKPGDYVVFDNNQIQKKVVTKDDYLVWTQNKLVFDNTRLSDVAKIINEHYGVEVNLVGDNIGEKTITGIMPNDNLDVLISSMEATQEFSIKRDDNTITINNKNQ